MPGAHELLVAASRPANLRDDSSLVVHTSFSRQSISYNRVFSADSGTGRHRQERNWIVPDLGPGLQEQSKGGPHEGAASEGARNVAQATSQKRCTGH
jgi:hypothetical protein